MCQGVSVGCDDLLQWDLYHQNTLLLQPTNARKTRGRCLIPGVPAMFLTPLYIQPRSCVSCWSRASSMGQRPVGPCAVHSAASWSRACRMRYNSPIFRSPSTPTPASRATCPIERVSIFVAPSEKYTLCTILQSQGEGRGKSRGRCRAKELDHGTHLFLVAGRPAGEWHFSK